MNCGRMYHCVAVGHRGLVQGLFGQSRVQYAVRDGPLHVRRFRTERCRFDSFFTRLRRGVQQHTTGLARACMRQVECIIAQRIRRGQQAGSFYFRFWDPTVLQGMANRIMCRFLARLRQHLTRCGDGPLVTASALSVFCWKNERIPQDELLRYVNELDAVACLRLHTCNVENGSNKSFAYGTYEPLSCTDHHHDDRSEDPWELFITQEALLVWRREVPNHRGEGLYEYKVYGHYDDITAVDFLAVHVDTKFRKEWDNSAVVLDVLESEPVTNSEVIYWEMQWPRMMSNRDYVYKRRYLVDEKKNVIVLVNQNTEHPGAPVKSGKQRVTEYWSIIVIKPFSDLSKPGLEFSMTYFDNPGLVFPSAFASWATATGFPDYLKKLHQATRLFADRRIKEEQEADERRKKAAAKEEEERRKKIEEEECERKKNESQPDPDSKRYHTPESWEVILGGGPVLSIVDNSARLSGLLDKIAFIVT